MDDVKKKSSSTGMTDENVNEALFNLKRLNDGYGSIVEKMGYVKFKPYLQRLFQSVEMMLSHEITEFKKIDAKYQDIVRQCHIYEKTLSMLKENNCCEMSSFNESTNTYAMEDLTKVTPYLAPDLLQSTMGATNGMNTSIQFRLPRRRSSLSNQQLISTPLGPARAAKVNVPIAKFDDEGSLALHNSLGFQTQEKRFVDTGTNPEPETQIEQKDFSCQISPISVDQQIETTPSIFESQSIQTDSISIEEVACQINPNVNDGSNQTETQQQTDFSCQSMPILIDESTETLSVSFQTQTIQTEIISTNESSTQITIEQVDQEIETTIVVTEDVASETTVNCDNREMQTENILSVNASTQYELNADLVLLPIALSEELPISDEVEILIQTSVIEDVTQKFFLTQECQTIERPVQDSESQSSAPICLNQSIQTDPCLDRYSSSLLIIPTIDELPKCSSTLIITPHEPVSLFDEAIQCNIDESILHIPIETEKKNKLIDRRSIIQHQLDEKEKQMNRIIEEYAALYGEYESERRRNMDLTEARDRLADHIKILSDELEDREINQEKLLIKSCQQNKLINYMLPHIDCSPMLKKKHHSASSFRRLLPKFK